MIILLLFIYTVWKLFFCFQFACGSEHNSAINDKALLKLIVLCTNVHTTLGQVVTFGWNEHVHDPLGGREKWLAQELGHSFVLMSTD